LYDLADPLRRFWWPIRHVVVANAIWGVLGAIAITWLCRNRRWLAPIAGIGAALLTIPLLAVQGAPHRVQVTGMALPPEGYAALAEYPDGVLIEVPMSPKLAGTQQQLIYQRWHHKTLLGGHALWVDRVRPEAWDRFVQKNSFLAGLQALEEGQSGTQWSFEGDDLQMLLDRNVRYLVVNREHFTFPFRGVVVAYDALGDALFGRPIVKKKGLQVWDLTHWNGQTSAEVPVVDWPIGVVAGGPDLPLIGRRPASAVFTEWATDP
jgi:hypothetical protein